MVNGITTNSQICDMVSVNQISNLLEHCDSSFILGCIEYSLQNKMNCSVIGSNPNIVDSYEFTFKFMQANYPTDITNISEVRGETYRNILNILSDSYNIEFMEQYQAVPVDLYSAAYYAYDFLVSNFSKYIIEFFAKYIYNEKNEIYSSLHLEELKRKKDSSTIYGKKIYEDSKMAIINANIDMVIRNILTYDIVLENLIDYAYQNNSSVAEFLKVIFRDKGNFYNISYGCILNHPDYPIILTNIRLTIQQLIKQESTQIS